MPHEKPDYTKAKTMEYQQETPHQRNSDEYYSHFNIDEIYLMTMHYQI